MRLHLELGWNSFFFLPAGPSCMGEGHVHVCAGTYPKFRAIHSILLQILQNCCRPLRVLWPGVGEAPGVAYTDRGADNTRKAHQGHFGQVLHPWEQRCSSGVCLQDGAFSAQGEGDEPQRVLSLMERAEGMFLRIWECCGRARKCPVAPGAL